MSVYDHPLVALTSRESIVSHFILLHLVSSLHLPSITPSALVQHARSITSSLKDRILGSDQLRREELELERPKAIPSLKGKERAWSEELGLGVGSLDSGYGDMDQMRGQRKGKWWRAWEVSAECKEIGGMECYGMPPLLSFWRVN
jgi:hypothetical protein